jgi:hypothetical protein
VSRNGVTISNAGSPCTVRRRAMASPAGSYEPVMVTSRQTALPDGSAPAGTSCPTGTGGLVNEAVSAAFWACWSAFRLNCHGARIA